MGQTWRPAASRKRAGGRWRRPKDSSPQLLPAVHQSVSREPESPGEAARAHLCSQLRVRRRGVHALRGRRRRSACVHTPAL